MYVVIMAGGTGTRFWPKSRARLPKQLLQVVGNRTMIQASVDRLGEFVNSENLFVVATGQQAEGILEQLPLLKPENLILEPKGKNTAPCIGLASIFLEKLNPKEVMLILPADHLIQEEEKFIATIKHAEKVAQESDSLVTIGIQPTYPATGYGYIQCNGAVGEQLYSEVYQVKTFAEKPDIKTAERFLQSGDFLWNSGIFLWKVESILAAIEEHLPELFDSLMEIKPVLGLPEEAEVIHKVYCQIKGISIDYGVMEHAQNVVVLRGDFGWNDVGSWEEVYKISEKDADGNVVTGEHVLKDVTNCLIDSRKKVIAAIGIDNLVIVETGDALLICRRDRAQEVKEIVEIMKRKNMDEFL
jgi:mannose-1-phosphate guanylyltransferase